MRKAATSLIAALTIIAMIIVLNSFCAGCVYAQRNAMPVTNSSENGIFIYAQELAQGNAVPPQIEGKYRT
mgnify:CR=1 FL=1